MRVLFLGAIAPFTTSCHRADAIRRLGHAVTHLDPLEAFAPRLRGNGGKIHYYTGYLLLRQSVLAWLRAAVPAQAPYDVCWVDSGELLGAHAIDYLKTQCTKVVLFNHDDPTGKRDWRRFATLRSAIAHYDHCAVVRPFNVLEFQSFGAKDVVHVRRTYDELAHCPPNDSPVPPKFQSDVAFIGGNIKREGRGEFLATLIARGLPVAIWGDEWNRSRSWATLAPHWRGPSISGSAYVDAIRGAKLCLGLLSKQNRDEHTTRSMEIPYAGGLLCAQRTPEHTALYIEGSEASFWSDVDECFAVCQMLLKHDALRAGIRAAGMRRVRQNKVGNEDLCRTLLTRAS